MCNSIANVFKPCKENVSLSLFTIRWIVYSSNLLGFVKEWRRGMESPLLPLIFLVTVFRSFRFKKPFSRAIRLYKIQLSKVIRRLFSINLEKPAQCNKQRFIFIWVEGNGQKVLWVSKFLLSKGGLLRPTKEGLFHLSGTDSVDVHEFN